MLERKTADVSVLWTQWQPIIDSISPRYIEARQWAIDQSRRGRDIPICVLLDGVRVGFVWTYGTLWFGLDGEQKWEPKHNEEKIEAGKEVVIRASVNVPR